MKILIIESEKKLSKAIQSFLLKKGFFLDCVFDGESGFEYAMHEIYDLILVDSQLNDICGKLLVRRLRHHKCQTPIVMISETSTSRERADGLNSGVDYFIEKTCEPEEFLACIYAVLRRMKNQIEEWTFGNTKFVLSSGILDCNGKRVRLSSREFDIMRLLMQNPEQNHSKEHLLAHVWGYDSNAVENHVEVYVGFLRKKLSEIGSDIRIVAVRRMGYHLECE